MLRIHQCQSAEAAQSYYTQGLSREDYYTQGQEIAGRWGGNGAGILNLDERPAGRQVDRQSFVALSENRHPITGERLTPRHKHNRTVGYDLNFHAPKGVSLLHALHRDERMLECFRDAVDATMREIEVDMATRVRKSGTQEDRLTANMVWAEFIHFTARPSGRQTGPDPHLHAHCFAMNATFDHVEERWKAGQFQQIVRDAPYYEAAFHSRLAAGLRRLGYHVERTRTGWDIAGLPRSLIEKFSNRTLDIEAFAAEKGITDPDIKAGLGARTRRAKDKSRSDEDLRKGWDDRLTAEERTLLKDISDGGMFGAGTAPDGSDSGPGLSAAKALDFAIDHCFERRSSIPLRRLVAEALRHGVGHVEVKDIWSEVPDREFLSRRVRGQEIVTTRGVLDEERGLLEFAVGGKGTCTPFNESIRQRSGQDWKIKDQRLDPDQRRALDHVLASQDRVIAIRGAAGVGKTTMMKETVEAIRAAGHSVIVVAPTANASRGKGSLREKGFPGADTVARLLSDTRMQSGLTNRNGGGVLWVDEAGLLGASTLNELFAVAEKHNARVVLCGDEYQHKPVERGDALRILQRLGGVTSVELMSIRRQQGVYRDAVSALADGDVDKGVSLLEKLDVFRELPDDRARLRAAARDYVETTAQGKSALVVSPTHAEGAAVARNIRELQREAGVLKGEDRTFLQLRGTGWTEAEQRDPSRYEDGLIAHFHQHAKGVVAGDKCRITVRSLEDGERQVKAVTPRGVEIDLPLEAADRFQVYRPAEIKLAVGDRVRITKNGRSVDRNAPLTNGMDHVVSGFTEHGAIILDGGERGLRRVVPSGFGHLAYGSVSTSHAAQGKDVDRVIIVQSWPSIAASSTEQAYVSISRGKQSVAIYTDNKENLIEAMRRSEVRRSGMELIFDLDPHGSRHEPRRLADRSPGARAADHHARQKSREDQPPRRHRDTPLLSPPKPKRRGPSSPEIDHER